MKLVFVSNYLNHHQLPVAEELYKELGDKYAFIQIEPMEKERIKMGWDTDFSNLPFLKYYYENVCTCQNLIDEADVVVLGDEKNPTYISHRLQQGKPILRYTERIYKEGQWKCISPKGLIHKYKEHIKYRNKPVYLLCAGAYVASDFSLIHAYPNKKYTWGYFPKRILYNVKDLFQKKQHDKVHILWAGRFLEWKHPEYAVELAFQLKKMDFAFEMNIIGDGDLRKSLEEKINTYQLKEYVKLLGFKKPEEVRIMMEESNIFLFTSDYKEGWGAVLNEAMNAGCAVVANCAIGAVPSLLLHNVNGCIYKDGDFNEFKKLVCLLIEQPELQKKLGENAYETICNEWNQSLAAKRLLEICNGITKESMIFFDKGPLSKAKSIQPKKMYKYMKKELQT